MRKTKINDEDKLKILFLSLDGVLNSARSAAATGKYPMAIHKFKQDSMKYFDPIAIKLIQRVVKETECKIVLTSSWRKLVTANEAMLALNLPIIDCTVRDGFASRGLEISYWLRLNSKCTQYAIIDGGNDVLFDQVKFFVRVDGRNGMSFENYEQLLNLLS